MQECQKDRHLEAVFTMKIEIHLEAVYTITKIDLHHSIMHPIYDYDYGVFYTI